jgi:hypothetical protein
MLSVLEDTLSIWRELVEGKVELSQVINSLGKIPDFSPACFDSGEASP